MNEDLLIGLASIVLLGVGSQWLAWRLKLPSILFLLTFGFIAGPLTGFLHPDELLGHLLQPLVSVSVAIILFEGGMSLPIKELREIGQVVRNLITLGVLVTWVLVTAMAYWLLQLDFHISLLLGAILVVTGPTVIGPLLRHVRPVGRVANILKWEGITIDPVGALLAVLVFEAIIAGEFQKASVVVIFGILKTIVAGVAAGVLSAKLLIVLIKRYWVPDFLHEEITLTLMIGAFVFSNHFQGESGLFAVTLMGMVLANQKTVNVRHIVEFKENLRVLIISSLFILLAARLQLSDLNFINSRSLIFLTSLVLIVRPASVMISSWRANLSWKERAFISWMAPRGIVAAAISSIFALRLSQVGFPQTEHLVPLTFMVIIGTVTIYGLTALPLARWLGLAQSNPQGLLIVGAHLWARDLARAVQQEGYKVWLVDSNPSNAYAARMEHLSCFGGDVFSEKMLDQIDLDGIGRLLALTSNDEANSLAALHFRETFGRHEVYQLSPDNPDKEGDSSSSHHLRGRYLFGKKLSHRRITDLYSKGAVIKTTKLTKEFDYEDFQKHYHGGAIPLIVIDHGSRLVVISANDRATPGPGISIIALITKENVSSS
ncbi:MAG TPA: cation:proton antiporter [bacterium]